MLMLMPRSCSTVCSQIASLAAVANGMYSASVVESATLGCCLLSKVTASPCRVKTKPVVDLRDVRVSSIVSMTPASDGAWAGAKLYA